MRGKSKDGPSGWHAIGLERPITNLIKSLERGLKSDRNQKPEEEYYLVGEMGMTLSNKARVLHSNNKFKLVT